MTRAYNTATTQQNSGGAVTPFAAGKNKIINGDFFVNQRAFTSTTTDGTFGFDRWKFVTFDGTCTYSTQAFSPGTAPVTGYEGTNYARIVTSSQTSISTETSLRQSIEGVRTVTGTTTISFWAQAGSGAPKIAIEFQQDFGSGGSGGVNTYVGSVTLSTSWTRYSVTFSVPSISGKTIGTSNAGVLALWVSAGSNNNARTGSLGIQSNTFNIWGVQVEAGSVATPFQTATGTIQGELAACQRYFANIVPSTADYGTVISMFQAASGSTAKGGIQFPVPMRVSASITLANANNFTLANASYTPIGGSSFTYAVANTVNCRIDMSVASGLTAGNATALSGNTANLLIQASAEL
jgi:hypothetical protein